MVEEKASETIRNDLQFVCVCIKCVHVCVCGFWIKSVVRGYEIDVTSVQEVGAELP